MAHDIYYLFLSYKIKELPKRFSSQAFIKIASGLWKKFPTVFPFWLFHFLSIISPHHLLLFYYLFVIVVPPSGPKQGPIVLETVQTDNKKTGVAPKSL